MGNWTECLVDKKSIIAIYGDHSPSLDSVRLHGISYFSDHSKAVIDMDLVEYPENPPKKWITQKCNTVQLKIVICDIESYYADIKKPTAINVCVRKEDDRIRLKAVNESIEIDIVGQFMFIETISAYQSDSPLAGATHPQSPEVQ